MGKDNVIFSYTAKEAMEDGVLVDVSKLAREAGFVWPVRITQGVQELCTPRESNRFETYEGRLWDVLTIAAFHAKQAPKGESMLTMKVKLGRQIYELWAAIDGTNGPAIHIMLPDEY